MPLNREQRKADRLAKSANFNRRELMRRQQDADLIQREYRRVEAKAYRLKVFQSIRYAKEFKRRQREEELEQRRQKHEDEVY